MFVFVTSHLTGLLQFKTSWYHTHHTCYDLVDVGPKCFIKPLPSVSVMWLKNAFVVQRFCSTPDFLMRSLPPISRAAYSHLSAVSERWPCCNMTGLQWIKWMPPSDLNSTSSSSEALYAAPPTWTKTAGVLEDAYTVCVRRPYGFALVMSALCFLPSSGRKVTQA